jgi:hypothetical protein
MDEDGDASWGQVPGSLEEFLWLDFDLGLEDFPYLVLGFPQDGGYLRRLRLSEQRSWLHIHHQTRGLCCGQRYLTGTLLEPTDRAQRAMQEISKAWFNTSLGCYGLGPTLDEILTYRQQLADLLGEDCNRSYGDLEEALYPIDIGPGTMRNLCTDDLPDDLNALVDYDFRRPFWRLFIVCENSD